MRHGEGGLDTGPAYGAETRNIAPRGTELSLEREAGARIRTADLLITKPLRGPGIPREFGISRPGAAITMHFAATIRTLGAPRPPAVAGAPFRTELRLSRRRGSRMTSSGRCRPGRVPHDAAVGCRTAVVLPTLRTDQRLAGGRQRAFLCGTSICLPSEANAVTGTSKSCRAKEVECGLLVLSL